MPLLPLIALATLTGAGPTEVTAPGAALHLVADGFGFTEGTVSDKQGDVYFTDQPNDRILRWNLDGRITNWMQPAGRSNGMWIDKKGDLVACADENNQLWEITPDQKVTVLVRDYQGKLLNGPNDVWIRPDGGMYITDPLYARPYWSRDPATQIGGNYVFYRSKDGGPLVPVITDLGTPNGIIGTPDGKTLYIGDLGLNATFAYSIQKDGKLTDKRKVCSLGSDGMTMDVDGDIYCTGKGVTVFDKTGREIQHIDTPEAWVGHVAFGGRDHRTLFVAASHGLFAIKMRVRGAY